MGAGRGSGCQQEKLQTFHPGCKPHEGRDLVLSGSPAPGTVLGLDSMQTHQEGMDGCPLQCTWDALRRAQPQPPSWRAKAKVCACQVHLPGGASRFHSAASVLSCRRGPERPQNGRWWGPAGLTVTIISDRTALHSGIILRNHLPLCLLLYCLCLGNLRLLLFGDCRQGFHFIRGKRRIYSTLRSCGEV